MSQILGVKFNDYSQVYSFSSGPFVVREGQHVIVKTEQGLGLGSVVMIRQAPPEGEASEEHKPIYRLANDEDMRTFEENKKTARDAHTYCRKCISTHNLEMKLVDVEVFFDRSKMVFYFTAPGRIDFRELIKDLVRQYRTRIELRQIGVRHETQMLGAIGNCGQVCCCRRFMRKFVPVTIKMAKEQNLFLNPTKISGICGRLLCCLSFEQDAYESFHKQCPKIGRKYPTSLGQAKVLRSNFFNKSLSLYTEFGEEREVTLEEWEDIVNKPLAEGVAQQSAASTRSRRKTGRPSAQGNSSRRDKNEAAENKGAAGAQGSGDTDKQKVASAPSGSRKEQPDSRTVRKGRRPAAQAENKVTASNSAERNPGDATGQQKDDTTKRPRRRRRRRPKTRQQ